MKVIRLKDRAEQQSLIRRLYHSNNDYKGQHIINTNQLVLFYNME